MTDFRHADNPTPFSKMREEREHAHDRAKVDGLPQMCWCEGCGEDVDVTAEGKCIHCGDKIWGS